MRIWELKNKICPANTNQNKGRVAIPRSDNVDLKAENVTGDEGVYFTRTKE